MRTAKILAVGLLALLVACGENGPTVQPRAASSTAPSPTSNPASPAAADARYVVYQLRGRDGLFLYDVKDDSVRRLTSRNAWSVRFRDADTVAYQLPDGLYEIAVTKGSPRLVHRLPEGSRLPSWSPDGKTLAYVHLSRDGRWQLRTIGPDGSTKIVKTVATQIDGRGGTDDDEGLITWSPDGTMLLVVDTSGLENTPSQSHQAPTMMLVRLNGSDVVQPRSGTFARFGPNGSTIYYRPFFGGRSPLRSLDVRTGAEGTLQTGDMVFDPAVSADGRYIAYHDGAAAGRTSILDLQTGRVRTLGAGVVPAWIAADALMVTDVRACKGDECGHAPKWYPVGKTHRLNLDGQTASLAAESTTEGDVRR